MNALALTGGHARTVEAMMDSLANQSSLTNSKISRALSEVRATLTTRYGNRAQHVQRWFVPSLLGAEFLMDAVDHRYPFDAARAAGDIINSVTKANAKTSYAVVPEVSILRLERLTDSYATQLFEFVTNTDRLFASKPTAIAFEELIVATLPLKMRLVFNAVDDSKMADDTERAWWPEQFRGALDRVRLFRNDFAFSAVGRPVPVPLLPCPSQVATVRPATRCAIVDEIAMPRPCTSTTSTSRFGLTNGRSIRRRASSTRSRMVLPARQPIGSTTHRSWFTRRSPTRRRLTWCCFTRM
jgi:hypothetical protein